jgi:hypothetical protein
MAVLPSSCHDGTPKKNGSPRPVKNGLKESPIQALAMPPTTPRDFLKAALQRLTTAETLLEILRITLEAQYLGGYTVECALKALILEKTAAAVA